MASKTTRHDRASCHALDTKASAAAKVSAVARSDKCARYVQVAFATGTKASSSIYI